MNEFTSPIRCMFVLIAGHTDSVMGAVALSDEGLHSRLRALQNSKISVLFMCFLLDWNPYVYHGFTASFAVWASPPVYKLF